MQRKSSKFSKNMKKIMCGICTLVLGVGILCGPAYAATGVNVESHTQKEIQEYIAQSGAKTTDALTFSEKPHLTSPYSLGKLSDSTLNSALAMLNQIRYIAGLSYNVQLDDTLNTQAQAAAVVNYANGQLAHYPEQPSGMSDEMYQLAQTGAGSSNLAWASWQGSSINDTLLMSWMDDGDSFNINRLGHRRWLLSPALGKVGFGAASGSLGTYSAISVFDRSNTSANQYGVMWPAQNMPTEYFDQSFPWSISMGTRVDITAVNVKLVRKSDGKTWNFSNKSSDGKFYVNNDPYGQTGCIIFKPDKIEAYNAGDAFDVTITGLSSGTVSYSVNFFRLQPDTEKTTKPATTKINIKVSTFKAKNVKGKKVKLTWKKAKNASGYQIMYAMNKKFTKSKKTVNIKKAKTTSKLIKNLKKKKTYYFKIRAYKNVSGKKNYGTWSKVKSVKIKK